MSESEQGPGREALAQIDRVLARRPGRDGPALTAAVQALTRMRDIVIARHRRDGGTRHRARLERVNALISAVLAAEFPLAEVPWEEVEKARAWLDEMLGDEAAQ